MEMNLHFIKNNIKSIFSYNKISVMLERYLRKAGGHKF